MEEKIKWILENFKMSRILRANLQKLIDKPVETTNERLTKCHCGSLLPKDGKSCGSMWCPNEH